MAPADPRSHEALLLAVAAGDAAATETFKTRHAALLEQICGSVVPDDRSAAEAYRDLIGSAAFGTLFAGFDGRGRWRTFVLAAVVNRFLFPRLLRRLARDPSAHAVDFEAFFRRDISRAARAAVPLRSLDRDAVQWIWEQLLDRDCQQLKTFAAEARTPGFVLVKLRRLAQDFLNSRAAPAEGRRRTLPECLSGLPDLDQDVFKQFYWWRAASSGIAVLALRQRHPAVTEAAVRDARVRVEAVLRANGGSLVVDRAPKSIHDDAVKLVAGPDEPPPFEEVERAAFRKALLLAAQDLTNREKLCLMKRLQGKAAGDIARELGIPNPEAYELMRRVVDKLRKALISHPAARERIATVTGNDSYVDAVPKAGSPSGAPAGRGTRGADR